MSKKPYWPNEIVETMFYKAPKSLADKIDAKVKDLQDRGVSVKKANKSSVQRLIVEAEIDTVDRFFAQELINR